MTLFKIAVTNMRKNFNQYLIYFISIAISVLIYFTFMSLSQNPLINKIFKNWEVVGNSLFSSAGVILILFVGFFIFYSNSYFLKKRKREFGLYALLGLRRGQISIIIIFENLLTYLLALVAGILTGIFFSKLFIMLLFWIVNLRVDTQLIVSTKAITDTIYTFLLIMGVTSVYAVYIIFRYSLLELFKSETREKRVKGSLMLTIAGLLFIVFGYCLALQIVVNSSFWEKVGFGNCILLILGSVILGTWIFIRYSMPLGLRYFYNFKKAYYRGTNLITVTSLRYRMKKNANTLAMIAVLSATTLTIIGAISSFYYITIDQVQKENPSSYQLLNLTPNKEAEVERIIKRDKNHNLNYMTRSAYIDAYVEQELDQMPYDYYQNKATFSFITESEFNRLNLVENRNNKPIKNLKTGEAVFVGKSMSNVRDKRVQQLLGEEFKIVSTDKTKKLGDVTITDFRYYPIFNAGFADAMLVVSDAFYNQLTGELRTQKVSIYDVTEVDHSEALGNKIQMATEGKINLWSENFSSYYSNYHMVSILMGTILYIGVFIGLVFFMATGSIIYFKQVTDAYLEQNQFTTLFKLGLTRKELRRVVSRQIAPMFIIPLLLGLSHSMIAMIGLSRNIDYSLQWPVIIVTSVYCIFYGFYYWICVNSYMNIVTRFRH
ncbi:MULTISPECIES: ABC transporter permease [Listeria]|uniref:ABC transporter permease n=1 Tax=Listeria TaxID=1637 RepID=UPI000B592014|nr:MULTISPECIES: ABC transporter permease [Listeria]